MKNFVTKATVTFAVVLVAVLGIAVVAGLVGSDSGTSQAESVPDIETPQYDTAEYDFDGEIGAADITMDSTETDSTVVIDGGPETAPRDVQPLVETLTTNAHNVEFRGIEGGLAVGPVIPLQQLSQPAPQPPEAPDDRSLADDLDDADGYVSVGVSDYTDEEIEALAEFADDGGSILLLTEPEQSFVGGSGIVELQNELDVAAQSGYVYNLETNDLNYQRIFVEPRGTTSLTDGVDRAVFDTAQPVITESGADVLTPIAGSELSTTRAPTDSAVMVQQDNVVVAGDSDFISPENVLRADNDELVGNIADFLVSGDVETSEQDETDETDEDIEADEDVMIVGPGDQPVFEPQALEIEAGDTVSFEWGGDGYNIDILNQPEESDWEGVPEPQEEGHVHEHTFEEEGIYEFQSSDHVEQGMIGGIIVGDIDDIEP